MKRAQHATETRNKILKVTRELLQIHGYQKTTTRLIIQECGIKNSTLYHFFANKEDILLHISLMIIEKVRELIQARYAEQPISAFLYELSWYYFSLLENTRNAELYLIAFRSYPISKAIHTNMLSSLSSLDHGKETQELEGIISMALGYFQHIGEKYIHEESFDTYQGMETLFKLLLRALEYTNDELDEVLQQIDYQEMERVVPTYSILSAL